MRITNSMMRSKLLTNLNSNMERLDKYQRQVETQKRITRLSDDPVGVITAMQARAKIGQLDRNLESIRDARTWTDNLDATLMEIGDIMAQCNKLAVDVGSDENNPIDRQNTAAVVKQYMEQLVQTANSSVGTQYMFAGFETDKQPFKVEDDGRLTYNGIEMYPTPDDAALAKEGESSIKFEIGYGLRMDVSFNGVQLMGTGDDNLYAMLDGLYKDLTNPDSTAKDISRHIKPLQDGQDAILTKLAEVGGREIRLDMVEERYNTERLNYTTRMSQVEDIDITEAMINVSTSQAVYNAALQTGAKMIQPTLMDYLR